MICQRCGEAMHITLAYKFLPRNVRAKFPAAWECYQCGMLYVEGKWVDMRAEPQDDKTLDAKESQDDQ